MRRETLQPTLFENNWRKLLAVNFELDSITAREHKDCKLASACCRLLVLENGCPLGDEGDSRYVDEELLFLLMLGVIWLESNLHWILAFLASSLWPFSLFILENKKVLQLYTILSNWFLFTFRIMFMYTLNLPLEMYSTISDLWINKMIFKIMTAKMKMKRFFSVQY